MDEQIMPRGVASKVGYYVYLLVDPRTRRPFYVGKGHKSRVLDHFKDEQVSQKTRTLASLKRKGMSPDIEILTHGLDDEDTAYHIEAAVIDLLNPDGLTNKIRGKGARQHGRMGLRQLEGLYARPVQIGKSHKTILIRVNRLYRHDMEPDELYEITRGVWKVSRRREGARYAMAVYEGVVREVYQIKSWHPAGTTPYHTRRRADVKVPGRWEFKGHRAPDTVRNRYRDRSVEAYLPRGSQSPIKYVHI